MYSLVIPVYMNEGSLGRLLDELIELGSRVSGELEVVFVVDGSPDRSLQLLRERLPAFPLATPMCNDHDGSAAINRHNAPKCSSAAKSTVHQGMPESRRREAL